MIGATYGRHGNRSEAVPGASGIDWGELAVIPFPSLGGVWIRLAGLGS
jgi:hypothetical protein